MQSLQPLPLGFVINEQYKIVEVRGQGTFGVVYQCIDLSSSQKVAIKHSRLQLETQGISAVALRQISILSELQHDNIIRLVAEPLFLLPDLFLVLQLQNMDLSYYLKHYGHASIPPNKLKSLMFQLLSAVKVCHSKNFLHRDVKPGNILINPSFDIKLADFGLARPISYPTKPLTQEVVTLQYRAPEILRGCKKYSFPVDIWSIGCVMAEVAFGSILFKGASQLDQFDLITSIMGTPTQQQWPDFSLNVEMQDQNSFTDVIFQTKLAHSSLSAEGKDLLSRLLVLNPANRITASQALTHPYFNS